jgi:hypothetical protein
VKPSALNKNRTIDSQESMIVEKIDGGDVFSWARSSAEIEVGMLRNCNAKSKDF